MNYVKINGKIVRKDPVYYLQDVFGFQEYDGNINTLYDFLMNIREETEIHMINMRCMTPLLFEVFKKASDNSEYIKVERDD